MVLEEEEDFMVAAIMFGLIRKEVKCNVKETDFDL